MECFSSNKLKDVNIVILALLVKSMSLSIGDVGDLQKQTNKKKEPSKSDLLICMLNQLTAYSKS